MEKVIHKFSSFEEQEQFEIKYWLNVSVQEKFKALEDMRAVYISTFFPSIKKIEKVVTKKKLTEEL